MNITFDDAAGLALGFLHSPLTFHFVIDEIKYSIYIKRMSRTLCGKTDDNISDDFDWFIFVESLTHFRRHSLSFSRLIRPANCDGGVPLSMSGHFMSL